MFRFLFIILFSFITFVLSAQNVLTLEQCINIGYNGNLQIKQYELQIGLKKSELKQKNFSLLPSLNGILSQAYSFGNSLDYTTYEYRKEKISSNYFSLNSDLTLFNGFRQLYNVKSARYGYLSSQESFQDIKDQISLNIAAVYVEIVMNLEQVKSADKQLDLSRKLYEKSKILVEVGEENLVKELQMKAQVANDEVGKIDAENQLELSYLKLKQLLNLDLTKTVVVVVPEIDIYKLPDYTKEKVESFIEESILKLPKVKKARYDFQSSRYNYLASLGQTYPRLNLQTSVDSRYSNIAKNLHGEQIPFNTQIDNNFGQSVSLGLSIPIFNNYQYSYAVQSAKIGMKTNEILLNETEINARNEIYQAFFLMNSANKKFIAADNNLKAQQMLFEQNNKLYEQGLINFYDWQQAKNNLTKAESTFLSSKYDYLYKIKVFEYYKGVPLKL